MKNYKCGKLNEVDLSLTSKVSSGASVQQRHAFQLWRCVCRLRELAPVLLQQFEHFLSFLSSTVQPVFRQEQRRANGQLSDEDHHTKT